MFTSFLFGLFLVGTTFLLLCCAVFFWEPDERRQRVERSRLSLLTSARPSSGLYWFLLPTKDLDLEFGCSRARRTRCQ